MKHRMVKLLSVLLFVATANVAKAGVIVDFLIDGDTFSQDWTVSNNSTLGEMINSFVFDLRPLNTYCYDIDAVSGCFSNDNGHTPFAAVFGAATTGLLGGTVTNQPGGPNNWDFLRIDFSNFDPSEMFSWNIDVDSAGDVTVFGNQLIGSTVYVEMSDGKTYFGNLEAVIGNSDASRFVITGTSDKPIDDLIGVPAPATLAIVALGLLGLRTRRVK